MLATGRQDVARRCDARHGLRGGALGHGQAQRASRVVGRGVARGGEHPRRGVVVAAQQREAERLAGQHRALAGVDGGGRRRERDLVVEGVDGGGGVPAGCRQQSAQPQQSAGGVPRAIVLGRLRDGAAIGGGRRDLECLACQEHHGHQRLGTRESREQGLGALHGTQAFLAPRRDGHPVVVAPVARLERKRLAQRRACLVEPSAARQRVAQHRPGFSHRRIEFAGPPRRRFRGRECVEIGGVVDAGRFVAEHVRVGEAGVRGGVVRRAGDGAAEGLGGRRQRGDVERFQGRPAALPRHERLETGQRRRHGHGASVHGVGRRHLLPNRSQEAIAAPRDGLDVRRLSRVVTEHLADVGNRPGEGVVGHRQARPEPLEEQVAGDQLAAGLGQARQ